MSYTITEVPLSYVLGYLNATKVQSKYIHLKYEKFHENDYLKSITITNDKSSHKFTYGEMITELKPAALTILQSIDWSSMVDWWTLDENNDQSFKYNLDDEENLDDYVLGYLAFYGIHPDAPRYYSFSRDDRNIEITHHYSSTIRYHLIVSLCNRCNGLHITQTNTTDGESTCIESKQLSDVDSIHKALDVFVNTMRVL